MTTQVVINGKEVTNPVARTTLAFGAILIAALIATVIVSVLLPFVGVVVTLSAGFVAVLLVATIVGITTLVLGTAVFGRLFGPMEVRVEKTHKRK